VIEIAQLFIYPVKSCRGISLAEAEMDARGFVHDREFLVVDENDAFITQRTAPKLALVEVGLTNRGFGFVAPARSEFQLPFKSDTAAARRTVTIFRDTVVADDAGDEAADWFSAALNIRCRLVRIGDSYSRPIRNPATREEQKSAATRAEVPFTDAFPTLVVSEESLADLNKRIPTPLPMNRFRPNIIVRGCSAYEENTWSMLRIADVTFRAAAPCQRCVITTIDQQLGSDDGPEPLRTLATYRRSADGNGVIFGEYLTHESRGKLRVGDRVVV
jgi:uncharacterized protein YcbX